jgi:heme/copper-type cytochrome/quinol oxidase subunit 2
MDTNPQIAYEATMAAVGSKATYGGASATVASWFLSSEFGMLMGIAIGVAGLVTNFYFKYKEDKRKQAEHDRKMGMYE